jgi:hypothetical protein
MFTCDQEMKHWCIIQVGAHNDPVFDLLIKSLFQLTVLETNIQKERPLHGDSSFVNQVFNMTMITSGNFFNTNCDVDHLTANILIYLVTGLNG